LPANQITVFPFLIAYTRFDQITSDEYRTEGTIEPDNCGFHPLIVTGLQRTRRDHPALPILDGERAKHSLHPWTHRNP
jgi:hypothetical protein